MLDHYVDPPPEFDSAMGHPFVVIRDELITSNETVLPRRARTKTNLVHQSHVLPREGGRENGVS